MQKTTNEKRKAERRYARLYRRFERELKGGLAYGMDWHTIHAMNPNRAAEMRNLQQIMNGQAK